MATLSIGATLSNFLLNATFALAVYLLFVVAAVVSIMLTIPKYQVHESGPTDR